VEEAATGAMRRPECKMGKTVVIVLLLLFGATSVVAHDEEECARTDDGKRKLYYRSPSSEDKELISNYCNGTLCSLHAAVFNEDPLLAHKTVYWCE